MTPPRVSAKQAGAIAAGALLLVLSVPLWPGTSTDYVVPRGASMEPRVSSGDLAVVRARGSYHVGEVAAYRNTSLHRVVVHRIVAIDAGTYTFKGDANSFVDPQPVTRDQIVGRLSFRVPWIGRVLLWLASPVNALLLVALVVLAARDLNRRRLDNAWAYGDESAVEVEPTTAEGIASMLPIDDERIIPISDMSFPHELAVAEVVWPESLLRLADRYDRPVLHDASTGALFVVESSMLFRCVVDAPAAAPIPLSVVRDREPEPQPEPELTAAAPATNVLPEPIWVSAAELQTERERRHSWPRRRDYGGRRKPSPYGRDWSYATGK